MRKVLGKTTIENQPALILEYIEGETLGDYIVKKELDLPSRLEIAVNLARRLADSPTLEFDGLLSHSGHAYKEASPTGVAAAAIARVNFSTT